MSTPSSSANVRSSTSFSDKPGADTFIPGSDIPLLSLTGPPSVTVQTTSSPSTLSTTRPILPSSTRTRSPATASFANRL